MPNAADILWFKQQFGAELATATAGTPFTLDMMAALACQETGEIWPLLRRQEVPRQRLLELCVGDTLDGRSAFPRDKAALVAVRNGQPMFDLARQALVDMAKFVPSYRGAARQANKFCHGFGIFQFDIQFFKTEPDYFLQKQYASFATCAAKAVKELRGAARTVGVQAKTSLTDTEMAFVAITYNTGKFIPSKGLKQGFRDSSGKFYGELFFDFLRLAHTIALPGQSPAIPPARDGNSILPPPQPVTLAGAPFRVATNDTTLRIRSEPSIGGQPTGNVVAELPDGHPVRVLSPKPRNGFVEVETSLGGGLQRGFAMAEFLDAAPASTVIPVADVSTTLPKTGVTAIIMPRKTGTVTKRSQPADAHSLNEQGQPVRSGTTPDELRKGLAAIINWLAVDRAGNKRYQPGGGKTFCNIYAHDYCFLAEVYLPRVWWSPPAIVKLSNGQQVDPAIGSTIDEQRANDLFRWLRDFGTRFGWRRAGSLNELQTEANQGAIGLIVARRKAEGRSGHIVAVVPETDEHRARRDAGGNVIAPLQSQAGQTNFRYGTSSLNWWKGEQFAESAFWLHA